MRQAAGEFVLDRPQTQIVQNLLGTVAKSRFVGTGLPAIEKNPGRLAWLRRWCAMMTFSSAVICLKIVVS